MSGQLHELIAVEAELKATANKLSTESLKTLNKDTLFMGQTRKLTMFSTENEMLNGVEHQQLTTTVDENLDYLMDHITNYWDAVAQKDATNQQAKADIVIDGTVLAKDLPVTFLLGLETKINDLRKVYDAIPTLAPGIKWNKDEQASKLGVFVMNTPEVSFKTEKDIEFRSAAEATKEHAEQIVQVAVTKNIGKYETIKESGMLTPMEKAMRINRLDKLLNAVKKSRQRANSAPIVNISCADALLSYINKG